MKKIAIVVDDYKLPRFEKRLKKADLTNYKVLPMIKSESVSLISILVEDEKFEQAVKKIRKICTELEIDIKRSN